MKIKLRSLLPSKKWRGNKNKNKKLEHEHLENLEQVCQTPLNDDSVEAEERPVTKKADAPPPLPTTKIQVVIADAGEVMESQATRALEQEKTEFVEAEKRRQLEEGKARLAAAQPAQLTRSAEDATAPEITANDDGVADDDANDGNNSNDANDIESDANELKNTIAGVENNGDLNVKSEASPMIFEDDTNAVAALVKTVPHLEQSLLDREAGGSRLSIASDNSLLNRKAGGSRLTAATNISQLTRETGGSRLSTLTEATEFSMTAKSCATGISDSHLYKSLVFMKCGDAVEDKSKGAKKDGGNYGEIMMMMKEHSTLVNRIDDVIHDVVCSGDMCNALGRVQGGGDEEDAESGDDDDRSW